LLRTFIAIEIPPQIKKAIAAQTASLQKDMGHAVRWVAPENIHLTLKFLGDISVSSVEYISQTLLTECGQLPPLEVTVGGLGCFPNPHRPRVIWIGLTAPAELMRLQHKIDAATAQLGYDMDEKHFSPHLTIGRVREQASADESKQVQAALESKKIGLLGAFTARAVHLFKSDLLPSGPLYTSLYSAGLGGEPPAK
jgi:2'-5' RNA ligase